MEITTYRGCTCGMDRTQCVDCMQDYINMVTEAPDTQHPEGSALNAGYNAMFDKYNDLLCDAISILARHEVTQNPITTKDYKEILDMLTSLRRDLHGEL